MFNKVDKNIFNTGKRDIWRSLNEKEARIEYLERKVKKLLCQIGEHDWKYINLDWCIPTIMSPIQHSGTYCTVCNAEKKITETIIPREEIK